MTSSSLQRLERLLVLVPWLLEHPGVRIDEASERFGVSPEELARDLDVLGYCGLPGYGGGDLVEVSVVGDRIVVRMADFFRRPLALSVREAVTLLLAGRALADLPALTESAPLRSALVKLERALGADARIAVDLHSPGEQWLGLLRDAVEHQRVVRLVYRAGSTAETSERSVEPWAVAATGGAWYLQGWCRRAQAARDFRLDRIRDVEVTGEVLAQQVPVAPDPPRYRPGPDDHEVVLEVGAEAAWLLDELVVDASEPAGDGLRLTFRTGALEWVARLLLRLGPSARVVAPLALVERTRILAAAARERYT